MKYAIGIVVIITLVAALSYIGITYQDGAAEPIVTTTPSPDEGDMQVSPTSSSPTIIEGGTTPEPANGQDGGDELTIAVPDNWEQYINQVHRFTAYHPPGIEIQEDRGQDNNNVRFLFTGAGQPEATDLVDGYSLTFDSGSYDEE